MTGTHRQAYFVGILITSCALFFFYQYDLISWDILHKQYDAKYMNLNGPDTNASDPRLISKLRQKYLLPPSDLQLELDEPGIDPSMGQSNEIKKLLKGNQNRFFIECGALDGETRSNTLYFEQMGWKGLLIEADPLNFKNLVKKNRKAWSSNTCLSTKTYPTFVSFKQSRNTGKISGHPGITAHGYTDVQCFPFETYLRALNVTTVDYFSLDVEGLELDILRTIDFETFNILTLSVEFIHDVEGMDAIETFMKGKGYRVAAMVTDPSWLANDFIFVKNDLNNSTSKKVSTVKPTSKATKSKKNNRKKKSTPNSEHMNEV